MFDFKIDGHDAQYINIVLAPGEKIMTEPGALTSMDGGCELQTVLGSGQEGEGLFGKLLSVGQRMLSGESLALTQITNPTTKSQRVVVSAPYQGTILPVDLEKFGGALICQKGAYLAGAPGTKISISFQKKLLSGLLGGEGFVLQKIEGEGVVFVHAGGALIKHQLDVGENVLVDTGCVVAFENSVQFDVKIVRGIKNMLLAQEGVALADLRGPGVVYVQSLPFSRIAGQVLSHLPEKVFED